MWNKIANYILKHRVLNLVLVFGLLVFLSVRAFSVKMGYNIVNTLPDTDSTMIVYNKFLEKYGEDGRTMFVGMKDDNLFTLEHYQDYYDLTEKIRNVGGVMECLSVSRIYNLKRNDSIHKFELAPLSEKRPESQEEVDAIREELMSLAIYDGLLFNTQTNAVLMLITLEDDYVNSKLRTRMIDEVMDLVYQYGNKYNVAMHVSGMPYIRELTTQKMVKEIVLFTALAIVIAGAILYVFFRSWRALIAVMTIVGISVIYMFGIMALFRFDVTILTGVLPPLLIIIGVENSIFMLNKYHCEFSISGDKFKALHTVIVRIGPANLLTNTTTAVSFASFIITRNVLLVPFGILASICIMVTYILTMLLLPTFFSYQKDPTVKNVDYLDSKRVEGITAKVTHLVMNRRTLVYTVFCGFIALMVLGGSMMSTSGRVVDDIAKSDRIYKDMMFFEANVGGVMPFDISIDTRKPKGVMNANFIRKVQRMQDTLALYPEFSRPLSVAEVVKFARQGFYRGNRKDYKVPSNQEFGFIMKYIPDMKGGTMPDFFKQYLDEEMQNTRISVQMANVTTPKIDSISKALKPTIDKIFPKDKYDVVMTGSSMVTLQGTTYLIKNLGISLIVAFIVIALLMALTFRNFKMVVISLIPNVIPLIFTAGVMGFCNIPLKMSTLLVFSIALGISVDNTIHYLSRYRLQLRYNNNDIKKSVKAAIAETLPSMIYSACILICGFLIFGFSSFGATKIAGFLVPFTLLIALITNIVVLPSMVLTFNKKKI